MRLGRVLAGFLLTTCAAASCALAQTGALRVRVVDPGGRPVAGAEVKLTSATGLTAPARVGTDAQGIGEFPVLRTGPGYAVAVQATGYREFTRTDIRVSTGETQVVEVRLSVFVEEQVVARAERPVVELDSTADVRQFTEETLHDLPVQGRQYQNVLTLAPGVVDPDEDGNPNVHGARARDVKIQLGGVANVDPLTGQWMSYVNMDSIEELEVIPYGAGVEFGRAQGAWGRILQKQGTNEFEGSVAVLYRSSTLDGNGASDLSGDAVPEFEAFQPSFQLSGPILADRLWFRLSHEWIERDDPVVAGNAVLLTELTQAIHSDQITWQASPRNKLSFHFDADPRTIVNPEARSSVPRDSSQTWEFGGPTYRLSWTAAQSPRLLISSEVGFQDNEVNLLPTTTGQNNECLANLVYPSLDVGQCFWTNRNEYSGSYYRSSRDTRQRLTVRTDGDWFAGKAWGISHQVRWGVVIEDERYHRRLDVRPDVVFTVYKGFFRPYGFATYRLPIPPTSIADVSGRQWGIYAEDQMKILENLNVTVGVRINDEFVDAIGWSDFDPSSELQSYFNRVQGGANPVTTIRDTFTAYESAGTFRRALADYLGVDPSAAPLNAIAVQSAFWTQSRIPTNLRIHNRNVAPRFSVAWDPWSTGKTKLALSAGRYYDKIFLAVPLIEQEPPSAYLTFFADFTGGYNRTWYGTYLYSPATTINQRTVDSNLQTPFQDELALSFEHEVSPEASVKVTLLRRWFKDQLQDVDDNRLVADFGRCLYDSRTRSWIVDPSRGPDGLLDDCRYGGDGRPDQYVQNPGWGDILRVGNLNVTDYRAVVLQLSRRLYKGWQLDASYTWSEAMGNAEDFDQILGNDRTQTDEEQGVLAFDQTHVVKATATGVYSHGLRFGGTLRWESGLPYSLYSSGIVSYTVPPGSIGAYEDRNSLDFTTGERNDHRNPSYWTIDLRAAKDFVLGSTSLQISVDVFNLLNDDTIRYYDVTDDVPDDVRRFGRRWQLGARLAF